MALVKVITGGIDRGKTTTARALEVEYRSGGLKTAGFLTDAEFEGGRKSCYYMYDIETGRRMTAVSEIAESGEDEDTDFRRLGSSRFYFNQRAFDTAAVRIEQISAMVHPLQPDVVFIDELGPLELSGEGHLPAVLRLLDNYEGVVILVIRETILKQMLEKLGLSFDEVEILRPPDDFQV